VAEGEITLSSGTWQGEPAVEGGASRPQVQLLDDIFLTGNVTADDAEDAVLFVSESAGGTGAFLSMALVEREGTMVRNSATIAIGDRVQIREAKIDQGIITLEVVQQGPDDPLCCPGELMSRSWKWESGDLIEQTSIMTGRLHPDILSGTAWSLIAWNSQELLPDSVSITLSYETDSFVGSAGCNKYFASVSQSSIPGDISIGPVGSTRMMCSPVLMKMEDRFQTALNSVNHFGFMAGKLFLGYKDADMPRIMLFERMTTRKDS
jgi:heat shock protein HslJ